MAHAEPRDAGVTVEAVFGENQTDWVSNAAAIKIIAPELDPTRVEAENENIQPRRHAVHDLIPGLKSDSTMTHGIYMTASGVNAADQDPAVATPESDILRSALGGRTLGFRADLAAGSAAVPTVTTDPGFVNGDWVFGYDLSALAGRWVRIEDVSASPALTLLDPLLDVPAAGDVLYAGITIYSDELAHDLSSANYTTLGWLVQGEHIDDVFAMRGCKPTLSIEGITAGERIKYGLDYLVADWPDVQPTKQALTGIPSGVAPITTATGAAASILIADYGSPLAGLDCRGAVEIEFGVGWDKIMGACGSTQGVKGYISTIEPAKVTLRAAFDDVAFVAEWRAGTKKHLLVQNGDQPGNSTAFYAGYLEYAARPKRVDEGGEAITELVFRAQEDPADPTGLTGDDLAQRRAPFVLLHTA